MNTPLQISIDDNGAVRMIPQMPGTAGSLVPELVAAFESHVRDGASRFILDLQRIEQLPPDLIAALYELTARARRSGGGSVCWRCGLCS